MKISKWGNSLAVRIPMDVARRLGLKEGDEVDFRPSDINGIELLRLASRRERVERSLVRCTSPSGPANVIEMVRPD